jgi:hypothetical protein
MDTEHFKIAADVGAANAAGIAVAARDDGIDDSSIAWSKTVHARTYGFDDAGKFVSNDAGIAGERIRSMKDMDI